MPITIDASIAGAASNAYGAVASIVAYLDSVYPNNAYVASTDPDAQARAAIRATTIIDLENYQGAIVSDTQRLKFPRAFILQPYDPNIYSSFPKGSIPPSGFIPLPKYYPSDSIIRPIFEGFCELTNILFSSSASGDPFGEDASLQIKRERIGPIETEYAEPMYRTGGIWRYPLVARRIAPLLIQAQQQRVRRG